VLKRVADFLDIKSYTLSTTALREGILIDSIAREHSNGADCWNDVRWRSVVSFGEKLFIDEVHASRIRDLTLSLCDQVGFLSDAVVRWRDLLGFAAYLHECGKFLNMGAFHKHGFYLIRHSNMLGFTQKELEVIGLLVRYHRKRLPKQEDDELDILDKGEVSIFSKCASILRVLSCLDRSRRAQVSGVVYQHLGSGGAVLQLIGIGKSELEFEVYEFEREKVAFEREFRTKLALGVGIASK
jgi:exopolyphosphatase/guanosine-5'-triphosphate,3'-diphosphate pyrophosphatase